MYIARQWHSVLAWLSPNGAYLATWAFVLEEIEEGCTRLIVRARGGRGYRFHGLPTSIVKRIVPLIHFVIQRNELAGIARRTEHLPA